MKYYYGLAPALIGVSIALVQTQVAVALPSTDVNKIAKEITVLIQSKKPRYGSAVIIKKQGNTYTLLTAAHVVEVADKYEIVTPDGQRHPLNYSSVKQLPGVDLAVVQFSSSQNYTVAKIGNSDGSPESTAAYVAGFPAPTFAINQSIYTFTEGKINANASKPLREGYALVYSNNTSKGMSGGSVLNEKGELIGIHGKEDLDTKQIKTGFNLGIPINTFLRLSAKVGVDVGVRPPSVVVTAPKADDFYIIANEKYRQKDYKGVIADLNKAIRLNPNYAQAYFNRGLARAELGDKKGSIEDYTQAIKINPNDDKVYAFRGLARAELGDKQGAISDYNQVLKIDPSSVPAYILRGRVRAELGDKQGAIDDFNSAIQLDPEDPLAHNARGKVRAELGDKKGAIADFNKAIKSFPDFDAPYYNRGNARFDLGDKKGAIADYNQAIKINSNFADAYVERGVARFDLGDKKGAITDFNQAITINPNYAYAYFKWGGVRGDLRDWKGAITAYNSAIKINPNYAEAYLLRGLSRAILRDKKGAIVDLQQAADLFIKQGNIQLYQKTQEYIREAK